MLTPLIEIIESGQRLQRSERSFLTPHIVRSVFLYFDGCAVEVAANPDTDEIVLLRGTRSAEAGTLHPDPVLRPAVGKPLFDAWAARNNRGYLDMLQLSFASTVEDEPFIVQMLGLASGVDFWSVRRIPLQK